MLTHERRLVASRRLYGEGVTACQHAPNFGRHNFEKQATSHYGDFIPSSKHKSRLRERTHQLCYSDPGQETIKLWLINKILCNKNKNLLENIVPNRKMNKQSVYKIFPRISLMHGQNGDVFYHRKYIIIIESPVDDWQLYQQQQQQQQHAGASRASQQPQPPPSHHPASASHTQRHRSSNPSNTNTGTVTLQSMTV